MKTAALRAPPVAVEMGEGRTPRPRPLPWPRLRACSAISFLEDPSAHRRAPGSLQAVNLIPPTGHSAGRTSAVDVLPGPRRW